MFDCTKMVQSLTVTDLRGRPPTVQRILNFMLLLFEENMAKSYIGVPGGLAPPSTGNPGPVPDLTG